MSATVYILTCITTLLCAVLLFRGYARVRRRLLLWSALCFVGLTITNLLKILDLLVFLQTDLYTYRLGAAAVAMGLLIFGLVWESQ
ncbi:DUF5985 family protein [Occallatibacter riparius]|uniref:DUF5985 family protein n=1 Tax=Occallatibacter riparius TaxID=1002689 RepID=A0A9J7BUA1_9BACT|nr:DUF5985 family protein [Occallatibacter riparius]UWZ86459.1 DUF5985 family protein [Occallatibacter riparius]